MTKLSPTLLDQEQNQLVPDIKIADDTIAEKLA